MKPSCERHLLLVSLIEKSNKRKKKIQLEGLVLARA